MVVLWHLSWGAVEQVRQRQFNRSDHSAAKEVRVAVHCPQPGQVRAAPPPGLLAQALLQCSNFSLRFCKGLSLISIEVCGFVLLILWMLL